MEVEGEEESGAFEEDGLGVVVEGDELWAVGEEAVGFGDERECGLVEVGESAVAEAWAVAELPVSAGVVEGPAIAWAWEVDPLGVSEFVAHEVEVSVSGGGEGDESGELVEAAGAFGGE